MTSPVVLQLSNERTPGPGVGFTPAFRALAARGELQHTVVLPLALLQEPGQTASAAVEAVRRAAAEVRPDVLFVQSPGGFPWDKESVATVLRAAGGPQVILWEGDVWGGRKRLPQATTVWANASDAVYSVAMGKQEDLFARFTRSPIRYVPHTVPDHLRTDDPVPPLDSTTYDAVHIGGRYVRFGRLERIEGALSRQRAVTGVRRLRGVRTAVHGPGWRGRGAHGPLPFGEQVRTLRTARLSFGWDHFNRYPGVCSNRVPISLYSGRVHVTSKVVGARWLPGPRQGLHQADTVDDLVHTVRTLLAADPAELHLAGLAGHCWVHDRLTDDNALRYMLGGPLGIAPPPDDPWAQLDMVL